MIMLIFHSGGHTNTFSHTRAESELLLGLLLSYSYYSTYS